MSEPTKKCFKCGRVLPLDEFYAHDRMGDGHLGKCRRCTKVDAREHRLDNIEAVRAYDRKRSKLPHRKARASAYCKRRQAEHPERSRANLAAKRAMKRGDIKRRPCHFCGAMENLEMHHPDYSQPLRVYWLCLTCHRKLDMMQKMSIAETI